MRRRIRGQCCACAERVEYVTSFTGSRASPVAADAVCAESAVTFRGAAASRANPLRPATHVTRTRTDVEAAGRGRPRIAVSCAVTGLGGQGRTRACGAALGSLGAVLALAGTIAHAGRSAGRVRGRAGAVARIACRNGKALSVGLPVQELRACRAPGAILVAADAIGYYPGRALRARRCSLSVGELRRTNLGRGVTVVGSRVVAVGCRCTSL